MISLAIVVPSGSEWIAVLISYLLGAVPFGWLMAKVLRGVDLSQVGSGNIGATNASRALGKPLGVVAFVLDFAKGFVPAAVIGPRLAEASDPTTLAVWCGAFAAVGHCWPVYLRFRGGKAVATWCGAVVALDPVIFLVGGLVWLAVFFGPGFVGLASILMTAAFPVVAWWRQEASGLGTAVVWGTAAMAVLIAVRHRANISRMLAGTEPRRGRKKSHA